MLCGDDCSDPASAVAIPPPNLGVSRDPPRLRAADVNLKLFFARFELALIVAAGGGRGEGASPDPRGVDSELAEISASNVST